MIKKHFLKKIFAGALAAAFLFQGNYASAAIAQRMGKTSVSQTVTETTNSSDEIINSTDDENSDVSQDEYIDIRYYSFDVTKYSASSISFRWYNEGNNDGFYIYKRSSNDKNYKKIGSVKNHADSYITFTDKEFVRGVKLYYKLIPYAVDSKGDTIKYSEDYLSQWVKYAFDSVGISSAQRSGKTHAKLKWKKQTGATGYEIYRKTAGQKYKLAKRITKASTVQWTAKNVAKTKKTYFKVRAYKTYGGVRHYGKFGDSKSIGVYSAKNAAFAKKLAYLQKKFPSGMYWNHVGKKNWDSWTVTCHPCTHGSNGYSSTCNYYNCPDGYIGYQCYGFAWKLSDYMYGKDAKIKNFYSFNSCKKGDVVRYSGHSVFVIEKHSDYITVGECNVGDTCMILWGRKVYSYELQNAKFSRRYK